ncbi:7-carboxy-7-deazaguanine synthase QueE, partial [Thermodesulfatator indicus]
MPERDLILDIAEIFVSLQGESTYVGLPTFFVRLAGCNLQCQWCDTVYAQQPQKNFISLSEILDRWQRGGKLKVVQITGGEPLLQENVYPLMKAFLDKGATVLLETNGSMPLERVPREVVKIMDIKPPSSEMNAYMRFENLAYLDRKDQVKFVIADREDYKWAKNVMTKFYLPVYTQVLFSPVWQRLEPRELAEWIIKDKLPVRF